MAAYLVRAVVAHYGAARSIDSANLPTVHSSCVKWRRKPRKDYDWDCLVWRQCKAGRKPHDAG